jgi:plastocyanin
VAGHFSAGDKVRWTWGAHTAHGEVAERFERRVQRTIKGERIVRNGSKAEPAYLVTQDDGGRALKSQSELHAARGS